MGRAGTVTVAAGQHLAPAELDAVSCLEISAAQVEFARTREEPCSYASANPEEVAGLAIRAYEKAGWIEAGERRTGRVGLERTMSLRL